MSALARLFWVTLAVIAFFLAALAVNQEPVVLHFLSWQTPSLSVFWWLLAAFLLGLLLGLLGITVLTTRLSLKNRKLTKQLGNAEQELHRVRNL
ncbi:MAG: lipopolysaccharide assembly protein LapA domain-containing protein, partial [Pseudomonadales bacterium]